MVARYLAAARAGETPVPPPHAEVQALLRRAGAGGGPAVRRGAGARRARGDPERGLAARPDAHGAPALVPAAGGDLDRAGRRGAEPVDGRGGALARGDGDRAARAALAGRPRGLPGRGRRHVHDRRHGGDVHRAGRGAGPPLARRLGARRGRARGRRRSAGSTRTTPSRARCRSSGSARRPCVGVAADARHAMDPQALAEALDGRAAPGHGGRGDGRLDRGRRVRRPGGHRRPLRGARDLAPRRRRARRFRAALDTPPPAAWPASGGPTRWPGTRTRCCRLPLASGALLLRDERRLDAAFAQHAEYLFHDRSERVYDQGVRSFQCSRRGDALKLWVAWQRYGTDGLGALYDHLCETTAAFHDAGRGAPGVRRAAPARGQHPLLRPPRRPRRGAARGLERVRAAATCR